MSQLSVLQSYCADAQINVVLDIQSRSPFITCAHKVALSNTSYPHQELMQKMTGTHNSQLKSPAQDNEYNNNQSASQRGVASELPVMKTTACSCGVDEVKSDR